MVVPEADESEPEWVLNAQPFDALTVLEVFAE